MTLAKLSLALPEGGAFRHSRGILST